MANNYSVKIHIAAAGTSFLDLYGLSSANVMVAHCNGRGHILQNSCCAIHIKTDRLIEKIHVSFS